MTHRLVNSEAHCSIESDRGLFQRPRVLRLVIDGIDSELDALRINHL